MPDGAARRSRAADMSGVGVWTPTARRAEITAEQLTRCAGWGKDDAALGRLREALGTERQNDWKFLMQLPRATWEQAVSALSDADIHGLLRFFTVAESQLPDWHGGDHSPVIWLAGALRRRGAALSRETLLWIRRNSDNRYLPYGNVNAAGPAGA